MLFDMANNEQVVELSCSYISLYTQRILDAYGFETRIVMMLTREAHIEGHDGHTLLEVWHPFYRQWAVVDMSFHRMYAQTFIDFMEMRSTPILLSTDQSIDPETDPLLYPRLAHIPLIEADGMFWYGDENQSIPIQALGVTAQYEPNLLSRFYPQSSG